MSQSIYRIGTKKEQGFQVKSGFYSLESLDCFIDYMERNRLGSVYNTEFHNLWIQKVKTVEVVEEEFNLLAFMRETKEKKLEIQQAYDAQEREKRLQQYMVLKKEFEP